MVADNPIEPVLDKVCNLATVPLLLLAPSLTFSVHALHGGLAVAERTGIELWICYFDSFTLPLSLGKIKRRCMHS